MTDLTYLNDASVLANLRDRYTRWLIYVCSCRLKLGNPFSLLGSLLDVFGFVLCGDQSVQATSHLHDESGHGLSGKEAHGSGSTSVRDIR